MSVSRILSRNCKIKLEQIVQIKSYWKFLENLPNNIPSFPFISWKIFQILTSFAHN